MLSGAAVLFDLVMLRWALRRSRFERVPSPVWPALFFFTAPLVLAADNA